VDRRVATSVRTACALGIGQKGYLEGRVALIGVLERGPELVRQTAAT